MIGKTKHVLNLWALLASVMIQAQSQKLDSLQKALVTAQDTNKLFILNELSRQYYLAYEIPPSLKNAQEVIRLVNELPAARQNEPAVMRALARAYNNSGNVYADQGDLVGGRTNYAKALALFMKLHNYKGAATSLYSVGRVNEAMGKYDRAMEEYRIVLKLRQDQGDKSGIAYTHLNIGNIYRYQGRVPEALAEYLAALKLHEEIGDKQGIAGCRNDIAIIYETQGNYKEALKEYGIILKIYEETGDKMGLAVFHHNLGTLYTRLGDNAGAMKEYEISLRLGEEMNSPALISNNYCNIADILYQEEKYTEAIEKYRASLKICQEIGDRDGATTAQLGIGEVYVKEGKATEGKKELVKGLAMANQTGSIDNLKKGYECLARADSALGDARSSFTHYKTFIKYRDSLNNEENTKKTVRSQMQYEFDKKEGAAKLEQEKKDAVTAAEAKRQRIILLAISGFGLLVLGFALFAYRSFLQKKKANIEISRQKEIIEEKQVEILDSIYYARRIQRSLLTNEKYIENKLRKLQGV